MTNNGLGLASVSSLAVDPQSPRTVYASTGALGLFKSGDGGVHWRPLATGLEGVSEVAVDPGDPAKILVADSTEPVGSSHPSGNGIATSTDAGRTWTTAAFRPRWVDAVAISGRTAYAGSSTGGGVFGSTDGGRSWRALGPPGVTYVQALAIAPGDPAVVYAGVIGKTRGLYKSTAGGSAGNASTGSTSTSRRSCSIPRTLRRSTSPRAMARAASSRVRTVARPGSATRRAG